jgi:hypothetical protein
MSVLSNSSRTTYLLGLITGIAVTVALSNQPHSVNAQSRDPAEGRDIAGMVDFLDERLDSVENKLSSVSVDDMTGSVTFEDVDVFFDGGNVHVRSGSGTTDGTVNGKGNLIVGYNELRGDMTDDRTGSHNIIVGRQHSYSNFGGFVGGERNAILGQYSTVSAGYANLASQNHSSVSGGRENEAAANFSSISGGNNRDIPITNGPDDWKAGGLYQDN